VLSDTAGGSGTLSVTPLNFSQAAKDLGLDVAPSGTSLSGRDVNPVLASGVFAHLSALNKALVDNDAAGITAAAEGLGEDRERVVRIRGQTGARLSEMESRQQRLEDQDIATRVLLSSIEDTDFVDAITRFQTLQTSLQASLQSSAQVMNLSLLDFLR
jgi:flagellar hook-associated protein 3 FlgL